MPTRVNEPFPIEIRPILPADAAAWEELRSRLWPDGVEDHSSEIAEYFAGVVKETLTVFFATSAEGRVVGLVELSIRTDLVGLEGQSVGYVEGLFVIPEARGQGVGRFLIGTGRLWARRHACTAFASDRAERLIVNARY
jgi:aminoglycoside 6'-N-acetyltransferase I